MNVATFPTLGARSPMSDRGIRFVSITPALTDQLMNHGADTLNHTKTQTYPKQRAKPSGHLLLTPSLFAAPMIASSSEIATAWLIKNGKDAPNNALLTMKSPPQCMMPDTPKPAYSCVYDDAQEPDSSPSKPHKAFPIDAV